MYLFHKHTFFVFNVNNPILRCVYGDVGGIQNFHQHLELVTYLKIYSRLQYDSRTKLKPSKSSVIPKTGCELLKAHGIFDLRRCHERSFVYNNRDICTLLIYLVRGASSMKTLHIMILFFDCNNFWVNESDILIKIFDNDRNWKLESYQSDCQFDIAMFIMQLIWSISCSDRTLFHLKIVVSV